VFIAELFPQAVTGKSFTSTKNVNRSVIMNVVTAFLNSRERVGHYFSNYFATSGLIPQTVGVWIAAVLLVLFLA